MQTQARHQGFREAVSSIERALPTDLEASTAPPTSSGAARAAERVGWTLMQSASAWLSAATVPRASRGAGERARLLSRLLRDVVATHRIDVTTSGDLPIGPSVIVANHLSYLDPIVIGSVVPCAPIAKAEVRRWPFVGAMAGAMGVIFVDRSDGHSGARALRQALRALRNGASVLVFPEGTTTDGGRLLPFASGAFGLAALAGVPVTTVNISYETPDLAWTGDASFLPHYLGVARRVRLASSLTFGPRLFPKATSDASGHARLARFLMADVGITRQPNVASASTH